MEHTERKEGVYQEWTREFYKSNVGIFLYNLFMVILIVSVFVYETCVYLLKKRWVFNIVISIGALAVLVKMCFLYIHLLPSLFDTQPRPPPDVIIQILKTCLGTNKYEKIKDNLDANKFTYEPSWPCTVNIPLASGEIALGALYPPLKGDILSIENRNAEFIRKYKVACAGPAAYGFPLNIITLAHSEKVLYNVEIVRGSGEYHLVKEYDNSGDLSRSRLMLPEILIKHSHGEENITNIDEAFCLQRFFISAEKRLDR